MGIRRVGGPFECAEPPENHEAMRGWLLLQNPNIASGSNADARSRSPQACGMSEAALSWVDILTSRQPEDRGTPHDLRRHAFFTMPGYDPPLTSSADWEALVQRHDAQNTSTGSTDSWYWDPARAH